MEIEGKSFISLDIQKKVISLSRTILTLNKILAKKLVKIWGIKQFSQGRKPTSPPSTTGSTWLTGPALGRPSTLLPCAPTVQLWSWPFLATESHGFLVVWTCLYRDHIVILLGQDRLRPTLDLGRGRALMSHR